ncbi:hypothetical protein ACVWZK_003090 [Bradyrhizobium sp. GM0.4]
MTATYTTPERLSLAASLLIFAAVAMFGIIHVAPNRDIFPPNEIIGTVGLYWSAALLFFGVWCDADWRRKGRAAASRYSHWGKSPLRYDPLFYDADPASAPPAEDPAVVWKRDLRAWVRDGAG